MTAFLLAALLAAAEASPSPSPEGSADPDLDEEVASVARNRLVACHPCERAEETTSWIFS